MCNFDSEHPIWEKYYPTQGNILAIGAHCPDCINWLYAHGAREVAGIDMREINHPVAKTIQMKIDRILMDVDGAEENMVIETHFPNPRLSLLHRYGNGVEIYRLERS